MIHHEQNSMLIHSFPLTFSGRKMKSLNRIDSLKVTFLGDTGVGKSCLMNTLLGHSFFHVHRLTTGPDFHTLQFHYLGEMISFHMWDTAGQEAYRSMTKLYFRNSQIILACYDICQRETFDHIDEWKSMAETDIYDPQIILIGTKKDLAVYGQEVVPFTDLEAKGKTEGHPFVETSALTKEGIEALMIILGDMAFSSRKPQVQSVLSEYNEKNESGMDCCS
jgi:small GTP-binding protein